MRMKKMEEEVVLKADVDVINSMTERFATQLRYLSDPIFQTSEVRTRQLEVGKMLLPPHWIEVAHEWSSAHHISIGHCVMALMHLQRICLDWWDKRELRTILDKALEEARKQG